MDKDTATTTDIHIDGEAPQGAFMQKSRLRRELENMQQLAEIKRQRKVERDLKKAAKRKERKLKWTEEQEKILKEELEQLQAIPEQTTPSSARSRSMRTPGSRASSRHSDRLRDTEVGTSNAWTQTDQDDGDKNVEMIMMQLRRKSLMAERMSRDLDESPDHLEEPEDDHDMEFFRKLFKLLDRQKTG